MLTNKHFINDGNVLTKTIIPMSLTLNIKTKKAILSIKLNILSALTVIVLGLKIIIATMPVSNFGITIIILGLTANMAVKPIIKRLLF